MLLAWLPVLLLQCAASAQASAQDSVVLHGRVLTANGEPLQGAQLQVLPVGAGAESDRIGAFRLGPLALGTYHVRVRRIGFNPDTVTISLPRAGDALVIRLTARPQQLDPVFSSALEQDLPRVMARMRQHVGATVFGPQLRKEYPGIGIDAILATDSALYPFMRGASFPHCHPNVFVDGKPLPPMPPIPHRDAMHLIFPDMRIRDFVRMKDIAVVEVYRWARHQIISEPGVAPDAGTNCGPTILIWTKGFHQRPYKGVSR